MIWKICSVACLLILPLTTVLAAGDARVAEAAQQADWAAVDSLIKQKADANGALADGTTALHFAARANDLQTAELLIRAGARVQVSNRYGSTPLDAAAQNGSAPMIEKLLPTGADITSLNAAGETVLMSAARSGNSEAVKVLLDHGAAVNATVSTSGLTALMLAVQKNHPAAAKVLIERGADVNAHTRTGPEPVQPTGPDERSHGQGITRQRVPVLRVGETTALIYAARDGRLDLVRMLLDAGSNVDQVDANGTSPLVVAVLNNYLDVAKLLLGKGADPNLADGYGRAALWSAVQLRNVEIDSVRRPAEGIDRSAVLNFIQMLLDRKANPNAQTKANTPARAVGAAAYLFWVDMAGETSFIRAAMSGDVTLMHLLLKYGADPKLATFDGTTALMTAAGVNWVEGVTYNESDEAMLEAVRLCLELGLAVNHSNTKEGFTALIGAANRGAEAIIEYLVSKGGDLRAKDKIGRTALDWAHGVFIGARTQVPKPKTAALIERLLATRVAQ